MIAHSPWLPRKLLALLTVTLLLLLSAPTQATRPTSIPTGRASATPHDSTVATYIIRLQGQPLALAGILPARNDRAGLRTSGKPDFNSASAQTYKTRLAAQRQNVLALMQQKLGTPITPISVYTTVLNGMAVQLTGAQAAQVARLPGVASVRREQIYTLDTDYGPAWIGADNIWDGSTVGVYAATILGANEVPPVTSALSGRGTFTFSSGTKTLNYTIVLAGFTGPSPITAAHIHRSTDGSEVAALMAGATPGLYSGSTTLTVTDTGLLQSDQLYVNFHTSANPGGEVRGTISGYKGEGMIVGIIDSGINTTHPSFAAVGGDGYRHINPLGSGNYKGACDPNNLPSRADGNPSGYNPAVVCNDKLIGTWTFTRTFEVDSPTGEPSPNDSDGHGSHVASTVAGNVYLNATINGAVFPRISGVAPHANIIAYDVCGYKSNGQISGSCPNAAILAAIEQATADGVDVINMSISGGIDPWGEDDELAFLAARTAGVVVSVSAGNSGPTVGSVNHVSPWLLSVAATTHNRKITNTVTDIASTDSSTLPNIVGMGLTGPLTTSTALVYAGANEIGNALCAPFSDAQKALVAGKLVICDRGTYGRVEKAQNVKDAGGVGYILANNQSSGSSLAADAFPIPGVHISYNDGVTLKTWVAAHPNPTAKISGYAASTAPANGDILAGFSSLGPSPVASILKPDIAAPGVDIVAAYVNAGAGDEFGIIGGTSMAAPHNAGAAALIAGLYPSWTPGQVQSAMMTTAKTPITKASGSGATTPFESGAGRIQVDQAVLAGLVLDESASNFLAANPATGGDPRTLNIPSFADPACVATCTWTRTVKSTLGAPVTWTASTSDAKVIVSPPSFTIPAGGTQTFTVTFNLTGQPINGSYTFGNVIFSAEGDVAPAAHFPIAARAVASNLPTRETETSNTGTFTSTLSIKSVPFTELDVTIYGLVKGTSVVPVLAEGQEYTSTLTVSNTARLVAEIAESTSQDIDLYIYQDDGDGVLKTSVDKQVCSSATGAVLEYCNLIQPAAGTYFVRAVNFAASKAGASDPTELVTAVVPQSSSGNFSVTGPTSSSGGQITLTLEVSAPNSAIGDIWYGWFELADAPSTQSLGSTSFNFYHVKGSLHTTFLPIVRR